MNARILPWLILLCITVPLTIPYLKPGYFPTQDGEWAVVRLAEMHRELKALQIPPRWAGYLNHGYGYPLFLFTYPLPYYIGEVFHVLGLGLVGGVKSVFIVSIAGSAVTMYVFTKKHWGVWGGLLASIIYVYAPYRLTNLFVRGSIGESLAMAFFPILLFLYEKLIKEKNLSCLVYSAFATAGLVLTHNATAVLFLPFLAMWVCFLVWEEKKERWKKLVYAVLAGTGGMMVAIYFWLPAVVEKKYISLTLMPLANKSEHFLGMREFLFPGPAALSARPPVGLGIGQALVALGGAILLIWGKKHEGEKRRMGKFFIAALIGSGFLVLPQSAIFWKLPFFKEIDFPWRMLTLITFFASYLGGTFGIIKVKKFAVILLSIGIIVLNLPLIKTQAGTYKDDMYYATNDATTTSADELMPIWAQEKPTNLTRQKVVPIGKGTFTYLDNTDTKLEGVVKAEAPMEIIINTVYFPGWKLYSDNSYPLEIVPEKGTMKIRVNEGYNNVSLRFESTQIRFFADVLSLGALTALCGLWLYSKKLPR